MKYALIADIHANLEGLEVVLEDAQKNNCTHYVCLGDVVGYNPNPVECITVHKFDVAFRNLRLYMWRRSGNESCFGNQAFGGRCFEFTKH